MAPALAIALVMRNGSVLLPAFTCLEYPEHRFYRLHLFRQELGMPFGKSERCCRPYLVGDPTAITESQSSDAKPAQKILGRRAWHTIGELISCCSPKISTPAV